jgi:hypothetical protein
MNEERLLTIGDRVKIIGIMNDPAPLELGDVGIVLSTDYVLGSWVYTIEWESGRHLNLLNTDPFEKLPPKDTEQLSESVEL